MRKARMTKCHFQLIANALANVEGCEKKKEIVSALACALRRTNEAFDGWKFYEACCPKEKSKKG